MASQNRLAGRREREIDELRRQVGSRRPGQNHDRVGRELIQLIGDIERATDDAASGVMSVV